MHVTFPSADLTLEGELALPASVACAAVICHPHPQYGGDMDNPVVRALETGLQRAGFATLRFNFRGVGGSTGGFGGGTGEQDDARAAAAYLQERAGVSCMTLAGYSFGAMVALHAGATAPAVDRLIAVAPPLAFMGLGFLSACPTPKLFIVGDRDQYCSAVDLVRQLNDVSEPKTHCILAGTDHFLSGQESAIAEAVAGFVATPWVKRET